MKEDKSIVEAVKQYRTTEKGQQTVCLEQNSYNATNLKNVWLIPSNSKISYESSRKKKDAEAKPLTVALLFSGCGGIDLGFEGDFVIFEQ